MTKARQATGRRGEERAVKYLKRKGWRIVERNFEASFGELDIIARGREGSKRAQTLCFVEVKTKKNGEQPFRPELAVTRCKRRKIGKLAALYLQKRDIEKVSCRFDVIAVELGRGPEGIEHFEAAFYADGAIRV